MAWEKRNGRGRYYTQSRRVGGRVRREYWGRGPVAEKVAEWDALQRRQREDLRQALRAEAESIQKTEQVFDELNRVCRHLVKDTLESAGYHRHHREWRKKRMEQQALRTASDSLQATEPGQKQVATNQSYHPYSAYLERVIEMQLVKVYQKNPALMAGAKNQVAQLRAQLLGSDPSILDRLLVEQVVLSWVMTTAADIAAAVYGGAFADLEFLRRHAEHSSRRFQASCKTLAQVRRLLGPSVQINIGERQVNVVAVGREADLSAAGMPLGKNAATPERG